MKAVADSRVGYWLCRMLQNQISQYENDADFIAEGLSIAIIENALRIMQQKGTSRSDLAQAMGIPKSQVSRIFNAPPNLTLRSIARIAIALGVEPHVLLNKDTLVKGSPSAPTPADND